MVPLLLALSLAPAQAADCDARSLEREVQRATPTSSAGPFAELAACDPARARRQAKGVFKDMQPVSKAQEAVLAGLRIGESELVRGWLDRQEPDIRSKAIRKLGDACGEVPAVGDLFATVAAEQGDAFWTSEWSRGLKNCRTPAVAELLSSAIDSDSVGRGAVDRTVFGSLLELYARNLGGAALPKLTAYLAEPEDEKEAVLVVGAFVDAAGVGSMSGTDEAVAAEAVAALQAAAPSLPPAALERARTAMVALGAEAESEALAVHRWADRLVEGRYQYVATLTETITCKNGKIRGVVHVGVVQEPGARWPDTLAPKAEAALTKRWGSDLASKCKGTMEPSATFALVPAAPEELESLLGEAQKMAEAALDKLSPQKVWVEREAPIEL